MSSRISSRSTSSLNNNKNKIESNNINNSSSDEDDEKINKKNKVKKTNTKITTTTTTTKKPSKKKENENVEPKVKPIPVYKDGKKRCPWVSPTSEIYIKYHDSEWGKPEKDSLKLFEKICLESQQAGLSWITVLSKREEYRKCFYNFDPVKIKDLMNDNEIEKLMKNEKLIRNRLKLNAIVNNAKAYCKMVENGEDFSKFIWSFVNNTTKIGEYASKGQPLTRDEASDEMAKQLKNKGFKFVGSTTLYAFMQSMGLVNDHHSTCEFNPINKNK